MTVHPFGRHGGREIVEARLAQGGLEARVITWGAILRDLVVPGRCGPRSVVLGFDTLDAYLAQGMNVGAVVGRYANRIGRARFRLGGEDVALVANENGNTLHGGPEGFSRRSWTLVDADGRAAHLALVSDSGDMGFPGRLHAWVTYEILPPLTLRITLQAVTDQSTPVNLTSHSYYNLDGSADVRDHRLRLAADFRLPAGRDLLPTGEITSVVGSAFDFRRERPIRPMDRPFDYDVAFVVRRERSRDPVLAHAATLSSPVSGIRMELWTTEAGLQLYDGHKLSGSQPGRQGHPYGRNAGVALEPQRFPDAPNQAHFPPCILSPGEVSRQITELRFSQDG